MKNLEDLPIRIERFRLRMMRYQYEISSTTYRGVINHLKSIFARHGIPQIVVSDNGPQYSSSDSPNLQDYKFNHITSSLHFPQANGESERTVQTVKGLLKRSSI